MAGEVVEPEVACEDVHRVVRAGSGAWRVGPAGRTWRLTREDLLAIADGWDRSPDELRPMVTQAIADALNREKPWRPTGTAAGRSRRALARADEINTGRPSASRVYDCLLGSGHNFAADWDLAGWRLTIEPRAGEYARVNRAFLHRAVRFLLDAGVREFLGGRDVISVWLGAQRIPGRSA